MNTLYHFFLCSDSKLTRVLQEALGGRCKTVVIATISPSITAIEESISTLNYAHSANGIVNNPVSSSLIAFGENMPSLGSNADSKAPPTVESWQEMEMRLQYMQTQVDEAQAALARKHLQTQEFQERAEKTLAELLESQQKLYDANKEIKEIKVIVEAETRQRKQTEQELQEIQLQLKKTEFILKATQNTESLLTVEAKTLISKLENIVGERNDLHALVVSQRDQENERRLATKQFQEAALVVLKNIESSFKSISCSVEAGQINALNIATENHESGRNSVSETQEIILGIAKNVSCVTESIKAQIAGEAGMVYTVETSTNSILNCIHSADDEFKRGEEMSNDYHESMRLRLNECTKHLHEKSSAIHTSTSQALQSFESKVAESRNVISHLVMKMKNSLSNLLQAKAEKANTLDELLGQWRDQSLTNSKVVFDSTKSNLTSLTNFVDSFENDMHNHTEIENTLEDQRLTLNNEGSTHVKTIDLQGSILGDHRQALIESHETQTKLRNEIMQSIMSGVQVIVSSEIEKLATTQMEYFQALDKGGADLASANEQMSQTAKVVLESMWSTNRLVSDKASMVRSNDLKAAETMKSTQQALNEVMMTSKAQHELAAMFASKSLNNVSEICQIDAGTSEIIKAVERDEKVCSASLINSVFKPTSAAMNETLQSSLDAMACVSKTYVPDLTADLDSIAGNRKVIMNHMEESFASVSSQVSDLAGTIASMAKTQFCAAEKLGNETLSVSNTYSNDTLPRLFAELDSGKEQLLSTVETLANTSTHSISEGVAQSSIVKQSVKHFAHDQIHCTIPVDPVPSKKEHTFSHNLSSTPDEEILLKGFDHEGSRSEDSAESQLDDSSQGSHDEENVSRNSAASVSSAVPSSLMRKGTRSPSSSTTTTSLPSPRLKYRDTNTNQWSNPPSSTLSHHKRPALNASSVGRKNRCPSGLPSPSKRIKR